MRHHCIHKCNTPYHHPTQLHDADVCADDADYTDYESYTGADADSYADTNADGDAYSAAIMMLILMMVLMLMQVRIVHMTLLMLLMLMLLLPHLFIPLTSSALLLTNHNHLSEENTLHINPMHIIIFITKYQAASISINHHQSASIGIK